MDRKDRNQKMKEFYRRKVERLEKKNDKLKFTISQINDEKSDDILMKLYESGLITYMRTDSKIYSKEFINKSTKYIKSVYGDDYVNTNINLLCEPTKNKKDNKVQEAHEAIRPTDITKINIDSSFDSRTIRMYKLIWKNTLESCMSPATYNAITSTITAPYNHLYKYLTL